MLIGFALAGILAAVSFYFIRSPVYQSEAKLFIRYLQENKSVSAFGSEPDIKRINDRGDNIINAELEILTSLDVAKDAAEKIGPEKLLGPGAAGSDTHAAAALIQKSMTVESPKSSSVIRIAFKHSDPKIGQAVLTQIIESYFEKHLEIHRKAGLNDEFLRSQTDQLKNEVAKTEERLAKIKHDVGITSLEDARKSFADRLTRITQDLYSSEMQFFEGQALANEFSKLLPASAQTNAPAGGPIPPEAVREYKDILARMDRASKEKQELETRFTSEAPLVKEAVAKIDAAEKLKQKLEQENPQLTRVDVSAPNPGEKMPDLFMESVRLTVLKAKINRLKAELTGVQEEVAKVEKVEGEITQLHRKRDVDDAQYRYYLTSRDASIVQESMSAGKVSNISKIQAPSPPAIVGVANSKILSGIILGSVGFGFALAFFIELYLNRTIRRPSEIETQLKRPLFLSIPRMALNGRARQIKAGSKTRRLKSASSGESVGENAHGPLNGNGASPVADKAGVAEAGVSVGTRVVPWDMRNHLRPFFETLRDRLILFFEVSNLTHKPKLVAVTSCVEGAGVTTTASGLASCLSETGDGNVLLVDMNLSQGDAHHFYKGHLMCGLDDVLDGEKRDDALVRKNLYVATEGSNDDQLPQFLPKRFKHLVPKLRASDYDYIIFDMPPVTQISPTPRLARFMDMVFLVVESEKTDLEVVKRATTLLSESNANVGVILNKLKAYVPKRLHQEV